MPKISVLMPVYNTEPAHLRAAIESILSQTCSDFEFIILDDASSDIELRRIILSYTDQRIIFVSNDVNMGISAGRNRLLDMARGEYIAPMDHDDISLPDRLAKEAAFLDEHAEVGIVGSAIKLIPQNKLRYFPAEHESIEMRLLHGAMFAHPASMLRRSVLLEHGIRYDPRYTPAEDYALWCACIGKTRFANLQEPLLHYRVHSANASSRQSLLMELRTRAILRETRAAHPDLWSLVQDKTINIVKFRLFGCIPLLDVRQGGGWITYYIFKHIPVLTRRSLTYSKHL